MIYKVKITMDNGQSNVILLEGKSKSNIIQELILEGETCDPNRRFITADAEDGNCFCWCVGKVSTIEILNQITERK